jgi:hypothetical protein
MENAASSGSVVPTMPIASIVGAAGAGRRDGDLSATRRVSGAPLPPAH